MYPMSLHGKAELERNTKEREEVGDGGKESRAVQPADGRTGTVKWQMLLLKLPAVNGKINRVGRGSVSLPPKKLQVDHRTDA